MTNFFKSAALCLWIFNATAIIPEPSINQTPPVQNSETINWTPLIESTKKSVVTIKTETAFNFGLSSSGHANGTGFLIDKAKGLIITNAHVTGRGISMIKVTFANGKRSEAKIIHEDPKHDYAIIHVQPADIPTNAQALKCLPSVQNLDLQTPIMTIGMPGLSRYVSKIGKLTDKQTMTKHYGISAPAIEVNVGTEGGASGSPILTQNGEVIGILSSKRHEHSSFAVPVDVFYQSIEYVQKNQTPKPRHLGVSFAYENIDDIQATLDQKTDVFKDYQQQFPEADNRILKVEWIFEALKNQVTLQTGDLILEVNNKPLGPHLMNLDKQLFNNTQKSVSVKILRNTKIETVQTPIVDFTDFKSLLLMGNAMFHNLTPLLSSFYVLPESKGVLMNGYLPGSIFQSIMPATLNTGSIGVIIHKINNHLVNNLQDFIQAMKSTANNKAFTIHYADYHTLSRMKQTTIIHHNPNMMPPQLYQKEGQTWIRKNISQ